MPTNKIQKVPAADVNSVLQIEAEGTSRPSVAGVCVDGTVGQLQVNALGNKLQINGIRFEAIATSATSHTATAAESGTVFVVSTSATTTITLPATAAGLVYGLLNQGLTSSGGHQLSPNASDKFLADGKADDADFVNSAATDALGDLMIVMGDGADGWYVLTRIGTWA